jgi:histidinol-phosphate phosphatase family protein
MGKNVKQPIIFLDRDGTIIKDKIYLNNPKDVVFYKDVFSSLKILQNKGYKFVIVTNQSGIARGIVKKKNLYLIHKKIKHILKQNGIKLFKIYFCPHHPDINCDCRKPKIGMVKELLPLIDKKKSFMIGDLPTDIEFGKNLGVRTIFIKTKKSLKKSSVKADYVVKNFSSAKDKILQYLLKLETKK